MVTAAWMNAGVFLLLLAIALLLALLGVLARSKWNRILAWVLAMPGAAMGLVGLAEGDGNGIFSVAEVPCLHVALFLPALGCAIGQYLTAKARKKGLRTRSWTEDFR